MSVLRPWLLAALAGLALIACGRTDPGATHQVMLPTAEIITPPAEIVRVVPLTFTPAPTTIELPSPLPNPADQSLSTAIPTAEATPIALSAPTSLAPPRLGNALCHLACFFEWAQSCRATSGRRAGVGVAKRKYRRRHCRSCYHRGV